MNTALTQFIGKDVEIVSSRNRTLYGVTGKIVDESKSSFKILVNKRNFREFKMVLKKDNMFRIGTKVFDGNKIMKRPEDHA